MSQPLRLLVPLLLLFAVSPVWAAEPEALHAVVGLTATVAHDARTAGSLGTERIGSGVLIDDEGLVLTIGYLVVEADTIEITTLDGGRSGAKLVAYDNESGFALLRLSKKLDIKPMRLGDSEKLREGDDTLIVSVGTDHPLTQAEVVSRRPFAGYWEYMLENAIFTSPPHPIHSGAALVGEDGRLYGIGSLYVGDSKGAGTRSPGNMFVPVNDLKPVLADLLEKGKRMTPPHPWIGINAQEAAGRIFITQVTPGGPAAKAGLAVGDLVAGVGGKPVHDLIGFYRALWGSGAAGTTLGLDVLPKQSNDVQITEKKIATVDRTEWLKTGRSY